MSRAGQVKSEVAIPDTGNRKDRRDALTRFIRPELRRAVYRHAGITSDNPFANKERLAMIYAALTGDEVADVQSRYTRVGLLYEIVAECPGDVSLVDPGRDTRVSKELLAEILLTLEETA